MHSTLGLVVAKRLWSHLLLAGMLLLFFGPMAAKTGAAEIADDPISWTQFQGDSQNTGRSRFAGISTQPIERWRVQLAGYCGEAASGLSQGPNGDVYAVACGNISAVDPATGEVKWSVPTGGSRSVPYVREDGTLFWGMGDAFLSIKPTGEANWIVSGLSGNGIFGGSPTMDAAGNLYFVHDALFSFTADGVFRWVIPFGSWAHTTPALGWDETIYVVSPPISTLLAINTSGEILWQFGVVSGETTLSIGKDGTIYFGTQSADFGVKGKILAISPEGEKLWEFVTERTNAGHGGVGVPPAIGRDGVLYVATWGDSYNYLYALNPDGTFRWRRMVPPFPSRSNAYLGAVMAPLVLDVEDNILVCTLDGHCYQFAKTNGKILWASTVTTTAEIASAPLLLADGSLLVLDEHAVLHSLIPSRFSVYLPQVQSN